jgi:hypothetical protein
MSLKSYSNWERQLIILQEAKREGVIDKKNPRLRTARAEITRAIDEARVEIRNIEKLIQLLQKLQKEYETV